MPGTVQTMMVDTTSDVPWVQCHPPPTGGSRFFDPTRSPTYAPFPCGSPACARLGPYGNGCINGQCQYRVTYPDGSSTLGTYSSDLLTIVGTGGDHRVHDLGAGLQPARLVTMSLRSHRSQVHRSYNI